MQLKAKTVMRLSYINLQEFIQLCSIFFLSPKAKNDLNIGSLYNFKISKPHNFC